jgi:capsular exopolysaccharide synthesis family protein
MSRSSDPDIVELGDDPLSEPPGQPEGGARIPSAASRGRTRSAQGPWHPFSESQPAERPMAEAGQSQGFRERTEGSAMSFNIVRRTSPAEAQGVDSDFDVDLARHDYRLEDLPVFEEAAEAAARALPPVPMAVLSTRSLLAEEFRLLKIKIRQLSEQRPFRCIGVVSASAGEGKTTVALGLAANLAQEADRRVLLIEADLRRPAIEKYLGIESTPGLAEWLEQSQGTVSVRRLVPYNFHILSGGQRSLQRPDSVGSDRMARLVEAARRYFDYIVIDCPPLAPVADSVILQDLVDGFLMVVRARRSPRELLLRAASQLKPDRIQGVIFNDFREMLPGYQSYTYRQYGAR